MDLRCSKINTVLMDGHILRMPRSPLMCTKRAICVLLFILKREIPCKYVIHKIACMVWRTRENRTWSLTADQLAYIRFSNNQTLSERIMQSELRFVRDILCVKDVLFFNDNIDEFDAIEPFGCVSVWRSSGKYVQTWKCTKCEKRRVIECSCKYDFSYGGTHVERIYRDGEYYCVHERSTEMEQKRAEFVCKQCLHEKK